MNDAKSLEVIGPFKGASGYDRHTREFVRHLVRQGVRVRLTHLPGWSVDLLDGLRAESLLEEADDGGRAAQVGLVDLVGGRHHCPSQRGI